MAVQNGSGEEEVYATLLLTDTYLPGALVLAHSLRDGATTRKLAVLVTLDTVSVESITALKTVYDYVIPVPRIHNALPANLELMNRTDLHSAFTKINLWRQLQFSKIVYIDADVVAYRAPDELFKIEHPFAAAPDVGWPDLFNTGVMVLKPNMGDYYTMMAMAERGISFDGADQGLINMHFGNNYHRISFAYNVTPSAHYQYIPAYRYSQSSISMVHFIGQNKPWFQERRSGTDGAPYDQMVGRWWAVYDKHHNATPRELRTEAQNKQNGQAAPVAEEAPSNGAVKYPSTWDAQRHPPPTESKPEAIDLPTAVYEMSRSATPFIAPKSYPSPPKDLWYDIPKEPPASSADQLKPVFPWETNRPKPSRLFVEDQFQDTQEQNGHSEEPEPLPEAEPESSEPLQPVTPDPWTGYSRSNVWDDVPGIERYVDSMQKRRLSKSVKSSAGPSGPSSPTRE